LSHCRRRRWLGAAIIAGALYLAVGIALAELAGAAASNQLRSFWRASAYGISAVVFAVHIAYEHIRLRNSARPVAWHASVAVALGAFALALVANIHDLGSASGYRPRMLIALIAWPLLTAVPAFIVALVLAIGIDLKRPGV
jgi:hypothetical protein